MSGRQPSERGRRKNGLWLALLLLFAACFLFAGVTLCKYYLDAKRAQAQLGELRDALPSETPEPEPGQNPSADVSAPPTDEPEEPVYELSARYRGLYERNDELAGWLRIEGTKIDYPVMLTPEEPEFYLSHSFDREEDVNGLPFLDSRCEIAPKSTVQIIYGHNMRSGLMFHDLTLYEDEAFWSEHQYITYDTLYERAVYRIVAAFVFDTKNADPTGFQFHRYTEFPSLRKFDAYKAHVEELALYDTGLPYGFDDSYLILATCEYSAANGRFVLLAKKIK